MPSKIRSNDKRPMDLENPSRITEQALSFIRYCLKWQLPRRSWPILHSITLYPPSPSRPTDWLVVGKATGDQEWLVSFHRSPDPLTAMVGFLQKVYTGKAVWKDDKYVEKKALTPHDHS